MQIKNHLRNVQRHKKNLVKKIYSEIKYTRFLLKKKTSSKTYTIIENIYSLFIFIYLFSLQLEQIWGLSPFSSSLFEFGIIN